MPYITGTESAETINTWWGVTDGFDVIYGYGGDDTIYALGGDDSLIGGTGADTIYGGFGNDTAFYFDSGVEVYVDLASGRGYAGTAQGDRLYDVENVSGSYYGDWLAGNASPNRLVGGAGEDWLKGGGGADRLEGGTENDTLDGGTDADTMIGGRGDDTFYVDHGDDVLTEAWSEGNDRVLTTVTYRLADDTHVETMEAIGPHGVALSLFGNGLHNTLIGNSSWNHLDGGPGADTMIGHGGYDVYWVDNAGDSTIESAGEGYDRVYTSVSYTLTAGSDIEELATTARDGTAPISLTGNASGNLIVGNNGNNVINGLGGNDELTGRGGMDWFLFDTPLDTMWNIDRITDFNVTDDTIRLDATIFSSSLTAGSSVAGSQFVIGSAALDAGDRIIYDNATGVVLYDRDGTGATAALQFAQLSAGLADPTDPDPLTNFDFFVVA